MKVDGFSKFRKTDRYKAEKLADDFIRTLTAKAPVNETQEKFEAEHATKKAEAVTAEKPVEPETNDEPTPAVSEAQARKQMEWRNMGQKDGTKSHRLFFFEREADKGTGRAMGKGEVSLYPGASGWKVEDGDGTPYPALADAKAAAIDAAISNLQDNGYVLKPAQDSAQPAAKAEPYDATRAQELKNDIAEGESIIRAKSNNGRKYSPDELAAVQRSVDSSKEKLAALGAICPARGEECAHCPCRCQPRGYRPADPGRYSAIGCNPRQRGRLRVPVWGRFRSRR